MKSKKFCWFEFLFSLLLIFLFLNQGFANKPVLDESDWNVLSKYLNPHEIFNLKLPSEEDINKHTPEYISKTVKNECVLLIKEALNPEFFPDDLEQKLIPMKKWGRPTENYLEKGGSDVFVCSFEKNSVKFQILDFADKLYILTKGSANENESHLEYARRLSQNILSSKFKRDDKKEYIKKDLADFTNVLWIFGNFIPLETIRYRITKIEFFTNGRFVIFILSKDNYSPVSPDPYYDRFKSPPTRAKRLQKLSPEIREAFEKEDYETLKKMVLTRDPQFSRRGDQILRELVRTKKGQEVVLEIMERTNEIFGTSSIWEAFYAQSKNEEIGIDPIVHKKLIELLDHKRFDTRFVAARVIGKIGKKEDVDVLIGKYSTEENEFARSGIISALINLEDERALPILEDVRQNNPREEMRKTADQAIEKLKKNHQQ